MENVKKTLLENVKKTSSVFSTFSFSVGRRQSLADLAEGLRGMAQRAQTHHTHSHSSLHVADPSPHTESFTRPPDPHTHTHVHQARCVTVGRPVVHDLHFMRVDLHFGGNGSTVSIAGC